jgi:hypothetical protein
MGDLAPMLVIIEIHGKDKYATSTFADLAAEHCDVRSYALVAQFSDPVACVQQAWDKLKRSSTGGEYLAGRVLVKFVIVARIEHAEMAEIWDWLTDLHEEFDSVYLGLQGRDGPMRR